MPYQAEAAASIVVANVFRHLQLARRSQTRVIPRANPERRNQAGIPDPARPPSLERCVASPIRRRRVVDSARRVQVDRRRSDDAALLSRLDAALAVPFLLLIVRFDKAIERFFPFRCSSPKASCSVPCNQPASHFVIPHFPRFISRCFCLRRMGASTYTGINLI